MGKGAHCRDRSWYKYGGDRRQRLDSCRVSLALASGYGHGGIISSDVGGGIAEKFKASTCSFVNIPKSLTVAKG